MEPIEQQNLEMSEARQQAADMTDKHIPRYLIGTPKLGDCRRVAALGISLEIVRDQSSTDYLDHDGDRRQTHCRSPPCSPPPPAGELGCFFIPSAGGADDSGAAQFDRLGPPDGVGRSARTLRPRCGARCGVFGEGAAQFHGRRWVSTMLSRRLFRLASWGVFYPLAGGASNFRRGAV